MEYCRILRNTAKIVRANCQHTLFIQLRWNHPICKFGIQQNSKDSMIWWSLLICFERFGWILPWFCIQYKMVNKWSGHFKTYNVQSGIFGNFIWQLNEIESLLHKCWLSVIFLNQDLHQTRPNSAEFGRILPKSAEICADVAPMCFAYNLNLDECYHFLSVIQLRG